MENYLRLITYRVINRVTSEIVTENTVPQMVYPLILEIHNIMKSDSYFVEFILDGKVITIDQTK